MDGYNVGDAHNPFSDLWCLPGTFVNTIKGQSYRKGRDVVEISGKEYKYSEAASFFNINYRVRTSE